MNDSDLDGNWSFSRSIYEAAVGADALVVLTEWEEYSTIDWKMISDKMRKPAWVFDSRSILVKEKIRGIGLNFWRIGDGENNSI